MNFFNSPIQCHHRSPGQPSARVVCSIVVALFIAGTAAAQSSATPAAAGNPDSIAWKLQEKSLQAEFNQQLEQIIEAADRSVDQPLANEMKGWIRNVDTNRQYIFLPTPDTLLISDQSGTTRDNFIELRRAHAEKLFGLAKETVKQNAAASFQLINQVVVFDPDHQEARRILGHRKQEDGWRIAAGRLRPKQATRDFELLGWPGKTYLRVRTDHFDIYSKASETQTIELAQSLERWYEVWRQVFFEYWSRGSTLQRWIDGKSNLRPSSKKFRVVFFKDREQYSTELEPKVPGISVSLGYYDDRSETSFFYAGDDQQTADTWRHEAAHQWFSESIRTRKGTFEQQDIWLGEGIAMYFESLADFGNYVTLGGFDARRLQYARIRKLRDKFYVPFEQLRAINRRTLQQQPELKKLYSQAAGLTQFLMNSEQGKHQADLVEYLGLLYRGKLKPDTFEQVMGLSNADMDTRYPEFLAFKGEQFRFLQNKGQTEFAFPFFRLNEADFQAIGKCEQLDWIDFTGVTLRADSLKYLSKCQNLRELYLASAQLHESALTPLPQWPGLRMLDLSGSNVTSRTVEKLDGSGITELRLVATPIDDSIVQTVAKLPKLKKLDIRNTRISSAAVQRLRQLRPELQIEK